MTLDRLLNVRLKSELWQSYVIMLLQKFTSFRQRGKRAISTPNHWPTQAYQVQSNRRSFCADGAVVSETSSGLC